MSNEVLELLAQVIVLLEDCDWPEQAGWFADVRNALERPSSDAELQENLCKLDKALSGMGSFTDLPLVPKSGNLSVEKARDLQWNLAQRLGEAVDRLRAT